MFIVVIWLMAGLQLLACLALPYNIALGPAALVVFHPKPRIVALVIASRGILVRIFQTVSTNCNF